MSTCGKTIKLKGGFYYTVRSSRDDWKCHYCGQLIYKSRTYIEERNLGGVVLRYHVQCFNNRYIGLMKAVETPSGIQICLERS